MPKKIASQKTEKPEPLAQQYQSSSDYLQLVIDSLDDELMVIDRDLRVTQVNAAVLKRLGGTRSKVIGQYCCEVFHRVRGPCQPPFWECPVRKVWETGKPVRLSHTHLYDIMGESQERYVDIIASPLRDSQGNITEVVELMRDVTEAKRLEQQIRELLNLIISTQEEERRRIARGLHDETSQALTSLAVNLEAIIAILPSDADEVKTKLKGIQSIAVKTLGEIHKVIYRLRPTLLDDLGLVAAVKWHAENYLEAAGVTVHLETAGSERRLPAQIETALFRIIQEATTNIVRHADAESVSLSLEFNKTSVAIHIEDDGRGFDLKEVMRSRDGERGLGLLSMEERAQLLGGVLSIKSRPGFGTQIAVEIPILPEVTDG